MAKKISAAEKKDAKGDKKAGVKEGGKKDMAMDAKKGFAFGGAVRPGVAGMGKPSRALPAQAAPIMGGRRQFGAGQPMAMKKGGKVKGGC